MWAETALRASCARAWVLALCALACASGQVVEPDGQGSARVPMPMP